MNSIAEVFSGGPSRRILLVKRSLLAVFFLGAAAAATGCGPVQSTQRISQAEVAFERARVVEAHQKAPYEYKSAQYYLHKAKEEWGYSDFEAAYDYATEAKSAAEAARLKAKEDPWPGHPVLGKDVLLASDSEGPEGYGEKTDSEEGPQGYKEEGDNEQSPEAPAQEDEKGGDSDGEESP